MPSISPLRLALAAGATLVSAHGHIQEILINGESFDGWNAGAKTPADGIAWQTTATDNGFVGPEAFGTSDIACHRGGKAATSSAKVAAGDKIELKWDTWPESHKGPVLDYLAACDGDCSSADPGSLSFFKIHEAGLVDGSAAPGTWASDDLIAAGNSWTVTIPASLKAGNYVLRHEIIALHSAGQENGAQNYPQCISIEVTGSGSDVPAGTPATSLYKAADAGIKFDIYKPLDSYPIPGPKVAVAGGSGGAAPAPAPAPTSAAPTAPAASSAPVPTTLVTKTSAAASSAPAPTQGGGSSQGAALYAQCGGQGFTGPTTCAQGTCKEQNPYYSQCL